MRGLRPPRVNFVSGTGNLSRFRGSRPRKHEAFDDKAAKWVAEEIRRRPWFRTGCSVLDIGAGTGLLTLELAPSCREITGFDLSSKMLEVMRAKLEALSTSNVTVTAGPLGTLGRFDLIVSLLAFHHVRDVPSLVKQLGQQHLSPGGRLLVVDLEATPNVRSFHKPQGRVGEHYEHDGFREVEVREWFASDFGSVEYVRRPLLKKLAEGWDRAREEEEYQLFFASAVKFGCALW